MIIVIRIKAVQPLIHNILGKPRCTRLRTGQQNDAVTVLFIMLQIFDQQFKTVVVRIYTLNVDTILPVGFQSICFDIKCGHRNTRISFEPAHHFFQSKEFLHLPQQNIAFFQPLLHALRELDLCLPATFHTTTQFIKKQIAVGRIKIIQKPHTLVTEV